jgi:outer membrane receptor protein involved in Fe transport
MKGTFLDGKLSAEASVFRIDWSDIQLPSLFGGTVLQLNGGEARVEGFELAFTAQPGPNTVLSAQVGHTDARLIDVPASVTANIGAVAGDQLPLTPQWTVALIADQSVPINDKVEATFGGTFRFRSEMPSGYPGDPLNLNVELPPMEVLDLRAGLKFEAFTVTARIENVLDEIAFNNAQTNALFPGQPTFTLTPLIRPRTFSLGVSTRF